MPDLGTSANNSIKFTETLVTPVEAAKAGTAAEPSPATLGANKTESSPEKINSLKIPKVETAPMDKKPEIPSSIKKSVSTSDEKSNTIVPEISQATKIADSVPPNGENDGKSHELEELLIAAEKDPTKIPPLEASL